jgi:hypothetical protein
MSTIVYANAEPIHKLPAKPTGDESNEYGTK